MSFLFSLSSSKWVRFKAFLAGTSTPATGKTLNVALMKEGATVFSNPHAGASTATEDALGWYHFVPDPLDRDTYGTNVWRAIDAGVTVDPSEVREQVVDLSTLVAPLSSKYGSYTDIQLRELIATHLASPSKTGLTLGAGTYTMKSPDGSATSAVFTIDGNGNVTAATVTL